MERFLVVSEGRDRPVGMLYKAKPPAKKGSKALIDELAVGGYGSDAEAIEGVSKLCFGKSWALTKRKWVQRNKMRYVGKVSRSAFLLGLKSLRENGDVVKVVKSLDRLMR